MPGPVHAVVRDVFVHLTRRPDGTINRRNLVVLPTLRVGG